MPETLIIVATYNEAENLPKLLDDIFHHAPEVDVLVVDDNSPDGTGRWCGERAPGEPRLHCLHRAGKLGLGAALMAGMQYAIDHGYTYALTMDADFSHPPGVIPSLVAGMTGNSNQSVDCMIGSRYITGGRVIGWPVRRRLMSRAVNVYARLLLGLTAKDCSSGYRCYRVASLAKIEFSHIRSRGYAFEEEILYRLHRVGGRLAELPIEFVNRQHGASKINLREAVTALWIILTLRFDKVK